MTEYKKAIWEEMKKFAEDPRVIFIGQQVAAEDFYGTLKDISCDKRVEMPVAEEMQMGISIGMALEGYLPISIYQRMDFLPRACDQIVNHLNLIDRLSGRIFKPRVIIRTTVGSSKPLDVGLQHNKNLIEGYKRLVDFPVMLVRSASKVRKAYETARAIDSSIMIVEYQDLYQAESI